MDLPDALTKKIGPLPAGAWILAIGGGIAVAVFVRRGAQDSDAVVEAYAAGEEAGTGSLTGDSGWDTPDPGGTETGVGGGDYMDWYTPSDELADEAEWDDTGWDTPATPVAATAGQLPPNPTPGGADHVGAARAARNNAGWRSHVKAALVARGYRGALVDTAFTRWWAGKDLTGPQSTVVSQAVAIAGAPPSPPKATADTDGPLPSGGGKGGGNGGGGGGGGNGGGGNNNDKHKWEPKGPVNRHCKKCGKKRDTAVHTNRG